MAIPVTSPYSHPQVLNCCRQLQAPDKLKMGLTSLSFRAPDIVLSLQSLSSKMHSWLGGVQQPLQEAMNKKRLPWPGVHVFGDPQYGVRFRKLLRSTLAYQRFIAKNAVVFLHIHQCHSMACIP